MTKLKRKVLLLIVRRRTRERLRGYIDLECFLEPDQIRKSRFTGPVLKTKHELDGCFA